MCGFTWSGWEERDELSSVQPSDLGPDRYRARWAIEIYFRDAKYLLPRMCLHTLPARLELAVFAPRIIASAVLRLLKVSKGMRRSRIMGMALHTLGLMTFANPIPRRKDPG
jgi:hypothetical protein